MLMISGGIDSPVAGFYAMKRGLEIEAVHFSARHIQASGPSKSDRSY
ncbi:7-cyano-7-deazaguanine synthase [Bacillus licheniformis]|nr:7-cyano-7-deazaguanine synthase [Bacillus licheniformis]